MAIITFPASFSAAKLSLRQKRRDLAFASLFGSQTTELNDALWMASLAPPPQRESEAGAWQAFVFSLRGRANQLALWNLMRPAPLGTLRGTLTLSGAHAAGVSTLAITGGVGQAGATLKQGDYLGIGSGTTQHLLMVMEDATADGTGLISVQVHEPLRDAFSSGASVTWDKPCALFRQTQGDQGWDCARGRIVEGFALDLIEDWRA